MKKIFFLAVISLTAAACNKTAVTQNHNAQTRQAESVDPNTNIAVYDSNLGVTFKFRKADPQYPTTVTNVAQQGDKIYVYVTTKYQPDAAPASGQWVEVLSKNSALNLSDAIRSDFLKDYSKCRINIMKPSDAGFAANRPASYEVATIGPLQDCPADRAYAGGIRYFMMDQNHSDKYAFFSIGQYSIPYDNQTSWDQTLEFK